jgi:hypothetical protein
MAGHDLCWIPWRGSKILHVARIVGILDGGTERRVHRKVCGIGCSREAHEAATHVSKRLGVIVPGNDVRKDVVLGAER